LFNKQGVAPAIAPVAGPEPSAYTEPLHPALYHKQQAARLSFIKNDEQFQEALTTGKGFIKLLTEVYAVGESDARRVKWEYC
jgi:hypothetical protein